MVRRLYFDKKYRNSLIRWLSTPSGAGGYGCRKPAFQKGSETSGSLVRLTI